MTKLTRAGIGLLIIVVAGWLAWRIVVVFVADRLAAGSPQQALLLDPHNPQALLQLAQAQFTDGQFDAAGDTARQLLSNEPLNPDAFVLLAKAAEKRGDTATTEKLFEVAVRRAPRDPYVRAWLIESLLSKRQYADALKQFDTLSRVAPGAAADFMPMFAQLSTNAEFARALVAALSSDVRWKDAMLAALLERGSHDAQEGILGELQSRGALSPDEAGRWLDRLIQDGAWGEAYGRWVGSLKLAPGASLPLLYNGDFVREPSGIGFDWRVSPTAGVSIEREVLDGTQASYAIHVAFSGRRVPDINMEQRLLLAPGTCRLSFRARAQALRSDKGLQWALQCIGQSEPIAASAALQGSFDWRWADTEFTVPDERCPAQRLSLRNPGAAAAGKAVEGDIWFTNMAIRCRAAP